MFEIVKYRVNKDVLLIEILSVVLILVVVFIPDSPLQMILSFPFVFLFPGYTMVCALFPRKEDLDGIERIALSIGLSLAIVPLIGLILNYTPFGIRLYPTLTLLILFIFSMSIMTTLRRKSLPPEKGTLLSVNPRGGG